LARQCAQLWLATRESLGHPLGVASEPVPPVCHRAALEKVAEKVSEDPRSFIIEIGTEEMPPQDVINASEQVKFHFIWRNLTFLSLSLTHGHLWAARSCCTILTSQTP
jgi:hypothetical protein